VAVNEVVAVKSALLPGSQSVVLDDLYHSHYFGRWYGSDRETVEQWWAQDLCADANLVENLVHGNLRTQSGATESGGRNKDAG
jgi:hypothetical protein